MRAFLAIEIEPELKEGIVETQNAIKNSEFAKIKFVEEENLHLTLKFFGEINERKEKQICKIVKNVIQKYKQYDLELSKIGAFPRLSRPRVIWIGTNDKDSNTISFIKELDEEFSKIGFEKEKKYAPHLTIGRVREIYDRDSLTNSLKKVKDGYYGKMRVTKVCLKSSKLTPQGPIYNTEKEFYYGE